MDAWPLEVGRQDRRVTVDWQGGHVWPYNVGQTRQTGVRSHEIAPWLGGHAIQRDLSRKMAALAGVDWPHGRELTTILDCCRMAVN